MPKRGKLSKKDKDTIKRYGGKIPDEELAKKIDRTVATVEKYRQEMGLGEDAESAEILQMRAELRERPEYADLQNQLIDSELTIAERQWAKYMLQFDDLVPTEETQVIQLITFEIFMARAAAEQKELLETLNHIEDKIKIEEALANPDKDEVMRLESQIPAYHSAFKDHGAVYTKYQEKHERLLNSLKATRDQRIKDLKNSDKSFLSIVAALEQDEIRQKTGREMELARLAMEKEKKRLGSSFQYEDGDYDQPLLSMDTVTEE